MKLIVYGTGKRAGELLDFIKNDTELHILSFVETNPSKEVFNESVVIGIKDIAQYESFDYIVIATDCYEDIKQNIESVFGNKYNSRIIHYADFKDILRKQYPFAPFCSVELDDGLQFIYESRDLVVGTQMKYTRNVFDVKDIKGFMKLSEKYYREVKRGTWFIDVGANIGTTSIYIKNRYVDLNVLAIEPGNRNFKLLKANCMINGMEDVLCCNYGISNTANSVQYRYIPENPGASCVVSEDEKTLAHAVTGISDSADHIATETVHMKTLLEVLEQYEIPWDKVGYLWIDTQGFEARIIEGALPLLQKYHIPIFQEFSPEVYKTNGEWEAYKRNIAKIYNSFIDYDLYCEGDIMNRNIGLLDEHADSMKKNKKDFTNLFFI